ncbi:MAG: sulfotransferase, partial [Sphingomicrobium sp.]
ARANLATVLYKQNKPSEAIAELERIEREGRSNDGHASLKAAALGRIGGHEEALALYREILDKRPREPKLWMSFGHILKTVGRTDEAIVAYRRAIDEKPSLGEAYWSLANLKTYRFTEEEIERMRSALSDDGVYRDDRFHLHFALGKAREDAGDAEASFTDYSEANRLRREELDYDPAAIGSLVDRSIATFSPEFFASRKDFGCPSDAPIFIVGLPRAGSTLVEQILASHPLVEGTTELPDIPIMARRLGGRKSRAEDSAYPECLADLSRKECRTLGEEYLERASIQRVTDKPRFIDKLPNNWAHIGFIKLILPSARIVDARRHPLACGFSNFKQHFARGQAFSYDLSDIGFYYSDYVRLLRHFQAVVPGSVYRVVNESLIDDPEIEIRALLDGIGLPFDPACLSFHENKRAVRTPSAEQVRQPVNASGVDQWRAFERWLAPLKDALGPTLKNWRN